MNIRVMTIEDFDQVHALWMSIKGFGIRSVDDSKEGVERFLKRYMVLDCEVSMIPGTVWKNF